jgi:hypothetical protein
MQLTENKKSFCNWWINASNDGISKTKKSHIIWSSWKKLSTYGTDIIDKKNLVAKFIGLQKFVYL